MNNDAIENLRTIVDDMIRFFGVNHPDSNDDRAIVPYIKVLDKNVKILEGVGHRTDEDGTEADAHYHP